eukprot:m.49092 g.49092  ORF g.49092 m.49092 type:complete len:392 (-) comp12448_c0_seq1:26-1201(-)
MTTTSAPMVGMTPCILCIGMAGSGKTSVVQRINAYLHQRQRSQKKASPTDADPSKDTEAGKSKADTQATTAQGEEKDSERTPCYLLNLDPAVLQLPYEANVDIRETVDYKAVMKNYGLGPNGAIVTCLNLFATKFDQALSILEKRATTTDYFLFDTPGQIEVFTWSASGTIITETLASSFPTVVLYVIDTPRCTSPVTFMSNMMYACSIMYKTRLPFILVFNKTDVTKHDFAVRWMKNEDTDESFRDAVEQETGYIASLARSMSLVLEEFYENLRTVGVSALTGEGMDDLFRCVDEAVEEYMTDVKPEIDALLKKREEEKLDRATESLTKLARDMKLGGKVVLDARAPTRSGEDEDDVDSDDYDDLEESAQAVQAADATHLAFMQSQGKRE